MSLLDIFKSNRVRASELDELFDLDFLGLEVDQRLYLKNTAIESSVNVMARTISTAKFKFKRGKVRTHSDFEYLLNVRPNMNQSAAEFWKDFVYTLLTENEVLVILSDNDEFLIADNFHREEYALYADTFKYVEVKGYTFKRTFKMSEVIYMSYNNEKFKVFLDSMFADYTELFSRMVETKMYENQIRALATIDSTHQLDEKTQGRLKNFINRMYTSFKNNAFAIVPKTKGFDYEEITGNRSSKSQPIKELEELRVDVTKQVANILGIPSALIFGDLSEYETAMKAYMRLTAKPLIEQIRDELVAKLIAKESYEKGETIIISGVSEKDPIDSAEAVDKLVSSGVYTRNEVREKFGDERSEDERLDEFVITKNYQTLDDFEGGEER